jgi:apolipoprotein N-acyltransferase
MRRAVAACREARRAIVASVITALALWAASPAIGAAPLAWVALVPVAALVVHSPRSREARIAVPLAYSIYLELLVVPALPFGLAHRQWHEEPVGVLVGGSPVLLVALVVVPLLGVLLYACRFGSAWGLEERLPRRLRPVALVGVPALAWAGLDMLRAKGDPTAFWGPLFLSQHDTKAARLAELGGPFALTLAIVACNYGLALVLVRRRLAVFAAAVAVGLVALLGRGGQSVEAGHRPALSVGAVQPGWDTSEFERPELGFFRLELWHRAALDMIGALAAHTREAAARGARLVVWPEAALWVDPRRAPQVRAALQALSRQTGAILVVPFFLPGPRHGASLAVMPDGSLLPAQPKRRPMWYLGERGQAGASQRPARAGPFVVGSMLGVDSQDPAVARRLAGDGATVIISSTHDWKALARPQRALAQLHALADGVPLVRADWRQGSAIYDAGGRLVADAGTARRRAVLVAGIAPAPAATPYRRFGAAIDWALAGLLAAAAAGAAARPVVRRTTRLGRRARRGSRPTAAPR